jgi:hypothetical protein
MAKKADQRKKQTGKNKGTSLKQHNLEKSQTRRFFFIWLPVIILVVLFFYVFVFDPPRPIGGPVPGTLKEVGQARSGEVSEKTYSVVLYDGRVVKLDSFQTGSIESGKRLLVQENVSSIFKRKSFSFVRYIE